MSEDNDAGDISNKYHHLLFMSSSSLSKLAAETPQTTATDE